MGGGGSVGPGQEADCLQCTCLKRPPRRQVFNTCAKIKESGGGAESGIQVPRLDFDEILHYSWST